MTRIGALRATLPLRGRVSAIGVPEFVSRVNLVVRPTTGGTNDDLEKAHQEFYKKYSPAVVGVIGGGVKGSGVIVSPQGLVLTSSSSLSGSSDAYILLSNRKKIKGTVVATDPQKELALIQCDNKDGQKFPYVELGDSDTVKIGQVVYVLGDSFGSIFTDGQVAISVGTLSGTYEITSSQLKNATYVGKVFETTAAVNINQNGAPFLNAQGKLIGLVTLNFHEGRFTGLAIPVNALKPAVQKALENSPAPSTQFTSSVLGMDYQEKDGGIQITRVQPEGPAGKGGLKEHDRIHSINGTAVKEARVLDEFLKNVPSDTPTLKLGIQRDGQDKEITIPLRTRKEF